MVGINNLEQLTKKEFIIPIYQRNYAWTDVEIHQLIDDIENSPNGNYHIGTLMLFDRKNNLFEVTDGQQRLTTLALILLSLKCKRINLRFEGRYENNKILHELNYNYGVTSKLEENELVYALKRYIEPKLKEVKNLDAFKQKLNFAVILNESILPDDINLHHYFERMNSRGKQLELHTVLRAKLLQNINDGFKFQKWDKCAELENYSDFNSIGNDEEGKTDLKSILENPQKLEDKNVSRKDKNGYGSIIDFSNFLLIALRVFKSDANISLNDKQLLVQYGYYNQFIVNPTAFLGFLVDFKKMFDKFIIKQSFNDSEPYWVLLNDTLKQEETQNDSLKITGSYEKKSQERLIKIQSMLHATYPSNTYKEWLFEALNTLWNNRQMTEFDLQDHLLKTLSMYAKAKFNGYLAENLPIDKGLNIPRIIFYFTDYLLWNLYFDNVRGKENSDFLNHQNESLLKKISKNKKYFNTFNFKSFSSIEHFYAQNPDNKKYLNQKALNSFGNLCLISRSSNSRYSNLEPTAKMAHSRNSDLNESLKQIIMFQTLEDDKDWNKNQIQKHELEIKELITSCNFTITTNFN